MPAHRLTLTRVAVLYKKKSGPASAAPAAHLPTSQPRAIPASRLAHPAPPPLPAPQVTAGGILLASSSKPALADALVGTVLAVGDDVDIGVAQGDTVLFSKYSSSDVEAPSGEVCFVAQKSVLAKLS